MAETGLSHVGLLPIDLRGRLQDVAPKANRFLDEPGVLAVLTLIDVHGFDRVDLSAVDSLDEQVQRVRDWQRKQITREDFFPWACVHQTEAWILAEGSALGKRLGNSNIRADASAELRDLFRPPTTILNDYFMREKKDRYHKIRDGRPLFSQMKFDPVYENCRYFRAFFDELRGVAEKRG
jgi:hypothetical protein